jgi:hypothetical protein
MRRGLIVVVAVVGALALAGVAAAKECKPVSGTFSAVNVFPPECLSPVGFCTRGTLTGDLAASYEFTQLTANVVFPIVTFTGQSTISRLHGDAQLFGQDTGTIDLAAGTFTTIVNIVGGTKQYEGATGQIVATGNLTATGTEGTYTGEICKHTS